MIRQRGHAQFDAWLRTAVESGVQELAALARGLPRDYAAVRVAVELPLSNGPTAGHVTKLKVVKRAMYGRATCAVMRPRVLCASSPPRLHQKRRRANFVRPVTHRVRDKG